MKNPFSSILSKKDRHGPPADEIKKSVQESLGKLSNNESRAYVQSILDEIKSLNEERNLNIESYKKLIVNIVSIGAVSIRFQGTPSSP